MIQFRRIVSAITSTENIAVSGQIKNLRRLRRVHGGQRWRKVKGSAYIELLNGSFGRVALESGAWNWQKRNKGQTIVGLNTK